MERDKALDVLGNAMADRGRLTDERETEVGQAIMSLIGTVLVDVGRIADAMDKLATPPEVTVSAVDGDEWKAQQQARDDREERTTAALEKIAKCIDHVTDYSTHGTARVRTTSA